MSEKPLILLPWPYNSIIKYYNHIFITTIDNNEYFHLMTIYTFSVSHRLGQRFQLVKHLNILVLDRVTQLSVFVILIVSLLTLLYWSCGVLLVVRYSETAGYSI